MNTKHILIFEPGFPASSSPVLRSQLLMQASVLGKLGASCYFFGADHPQNVTQDNICSLREQFNLKECHLVPVAELGRSWRVIAQATCVASKVMLDNIDRIKPDASYSWILPAASKLEQIGRLRTGKTVYFCQGALSEEIRLKKGLKSLIGSHYLSLKERSLLPRVDRILAVSENMKAWIRGMAPNAQIDVLPCCVDTDRFRRASFEERSNMRRQLGWSNSVPVVVYSGGASYWQRLPDIIHLLAAVQKHIPDLHIVFLSGAAEQIRSVLHNEVPAWLGVADAAIVLREDNLVNRVASPIKIGEYLSCGIPVIATAFIGDYSKRIADAHAGLIVKEPADASEVASFLQNRTILRHCADNAVKLARDFSWISAADKLACVFEL
jgi:glycosyltransferase involved in cell wall biosynthesis